MKYILFFCLILNTLSAQAMDIAKVRRQVAEAKRKKATEAAKLAGESPSQQNLQKSTTQGPPFDAALYSSKHKELSQHKGLITWDFIKDIAQSGYCLRHISFVQTAKKEKREGFYGDAVNISLGVFNIIDDLLDDEQRDNFGHQVQLLKDGFYEEIFSVINKNLSEEQKIEVAHRYEVALRQFILSSFDDDNNFDPESINKDWEAEWVQKVKNRTSFLVIIRNKGFRDAKKYYNLGKIGRNRVNWDEIVDAIWFDKGINLKKLEHLSKTEKLCELRQVLLEHYVKSIINLAKANTGQYSF